MNAEILRRSDELGVIAPGALADLLVLDGNSLEDLSVLATPEDSLRIILKDGRFLRDRLG